MPFDRFGRNIHYLRISLTDRCNLRCIYCMEEGTTFQPSRRLMQKEEIRFLAQLFAELGFDKIRLTGGEPTVRKDLLDIVHGLTQIPGINTVVMTTNGILLPKLAGPLAEAGLSRVNISLDTLQPERLRRIACRGSLASVWDGILAAEQAELTPVKLNAVIVRGYNDDEVTALARLTLDHPWEVRFIEMMPFGGVTDLQLEHSVPAAEMRTRLEQAFGPLAVVNGGNLDGEAVLFHIPGAQGNIGFISPVSAPFCASCGRVRLTAEGLLRTCLLREQELDLLTPLREGATAEELRQKILPAIWEKPWGHGLAEGEIPLNRPMSEIGG